MSTHAGIVKTPDVLHGKPRVEGTRIGVYMLGESIRGGGQTIEDLLHGYPDLDRQALDAALGYYDDHPEEMEELRAEEEAIVERLQTRTAATDEQGESDTGA